jgi:hypothetical protein
VLLDDERAAQRDHEQHAEQPADERDGRHLRPRQRVAEQQQRRQREHRPAAIDSPAEPVVWTMLLRRIDGRPPGHAVSQRKIVIDSTAIGIDALTVRPILSARYTLEAAKTSRAARRADGAGGELGQVGAAGT